MSQIHVTTDIILVCLDCGTPLHWFQEDKPWSEYHTLRVQSCLKCAAQHSVQPTADAGRSLTERRVVIPLGENAAQNK